MDNSKQETANEVAEKMYKPQDNDSSNSVDKGISDTHEQVKDTYTEGTVDEKIDNAKEDEEKDN